MNTHYVLGSIVSLLASLLSAQQIKMSVKVIDENSVPVTNATAVISSFSHWVPGEAAGRDIFNTYKEQTDTNGLSRFSMSNNRGDITYSAYAPGFYGDCTQRFVYEKANGKWQPENKIFTVQLKRILNPAPMYAKRVQSSFKLRNPKDSPAFDLVKGDWVKPYGDGEVADFIFSVEYSGRTVTNLTDEAFNTIKQKYGESMARQSQRLATKSTYVMKFEMVFSNADDGIYCVPVPPRQGSVLRLPYSAPDSGYDPVLKQEIRRNDGDRNEKRSFSEDQNYFFRVRTKKNNKEEIVSALYGKIYDPVEFRMKDEFSVKFMYYLNPEPNDRNTEFDTKRNLFPDSRATWGLRP